MRWEDWLSLASVVLVGLATILNYLRKAPIVPASQLNEQRKQSTELRAENADLRAQVTDLRESKRLCEMTLYALRSDNQFLQDELRRLRARKQ